MRKAMYAVIGVFGFILVFCISGLISYFLFPKSSDSGDIDGIYGEEAMARIDLAGGEGAADNGAEVRESEMLTIITPSLDRAQTLVRIGTVSDILPKTYTRAETPTELVSENTDESEAPKRENGGETAQKEENKKPESQNTPQTNAESAKPQEEVNRRPEGTQEEIRQPEETPKDRIEAPEEQIEAPQTPQLAPGIQTSDTGL